MSASLEITGHPLIVRVFLRIGQVVGIFLMMAAFFRIPSVVSYARDAARMHDWSVVPATVLEADYRAESNENENEMVFARYRYEYDGAEYEGTAALMSRTARISFTSFRSGCGGSSPSMLITVHRSMLT